MTHALNKLINGLTLFLVRYHDYQSIRTGKFPTLIPTQNQKDLRACDEYVSGLLKKVSYEDELKKISKETTSNYIERSSLLDYIITEITILKELTAREIPFSDTELPRYKQKITNLFTDIIKVLNLPKNAKPHEILIDSLDGRVKDEVRFTVYGSLDTGYVKTSLCHSGMYLEQEVLKKFGLDTESSEYAIELAANELCHGHQDILKLTNALSRSKEEAELIRADHGSIMQLHVEEKERVNSMEELLAANKKDLATTQSENMLLLQKQQEQEEQLNAARLESSQSLQELQIVRESLAAAQERLKTATSTNAELLQEQQKQQEQHSTTQGQLNTALSEQRKLEQELQMVRESLRVTTKKLQTTESTQQQKSEQLTRAEERLELALSENIQHLQERQKLEESLAATEEKLKITESMLVQEQKKKTAKTSTPLPKHYSHGFFYPGIIPQQRTTIPTMYYPPLTSSASPSILGDDPDIEADMTPLPVNRY